MAPAPHVWLVQGTILAQRALGRRVGSNWFVLPPGTCGAVPEPNGIVKLYWGGADTVMCVGESNISELVALCLENGRPAK